MSRRNFAPGTTVVVKALPEGRDLPAELIGAQAIVVKLLSQGTTHMHTIDTVRSVGGRRRYVLMPGTCLKLYDEKEEQKKEAKKVKMVDPVREEMEWKSDLITDELKAWPLAKVDPKSSVYERVWHKRLKLHAMRIKIMHELYN
jgi:hypothetical protein